MSVPQARGYALAVGCGVVCLGLAALPGLDGRHLAPVFFLSVVATARLGGFGPSLLCTFLGALAVSLPLSLGPMPQGGQKADGLHAALLLACGLAIGALIEGLHRGRRRDRRHIRHLIESENRLRESLRQAAELRVALDEHALVAIADPEGRITFVNDRFCSVSGYSRDELLGGIHPIIGSDLHSEEFLREFWRTIRQGKVWHGEVQNRAKDGSLHWTNTTVVPAFGDSGSPRHYVVIRTDITTRKLADDEVQRQRAELQILFDLNPAMIWFKDTQNNHLRVNQRAADSLGLPVSAIEGRPAAAVYPKEAQAFYADDLEVILSGRPKLGIVEAIHDKDGNELWIETNKVPYCDAKGKVAGIVVTAQDITERKRADEALRQSEERFRLLAENVNEIFWIAEPSGGRILYVSPAFEKICGRSCASFYADPGQWIAAIHDEDRERVRIAYAHLIEEPYDQIFRILRPDGEVRWVHDRGYPVRDASGNIYRLVGTTEDITATRRLQNQLLQAQKMEAIGTLAGGIAHDFNNILGGIIGYTELVRMRAKDDAPTRGHLDAVLQACRRAADLVRQILAFSRRQETRADTIQLRPLIAEALKLLRASIPATIEFDVSLAPDAAPVRADPTQIHQLVLNLCSNAEHSMRGRAGRLGLRLENFLVDERFAATHPKLRAGPHVRVVVSDTGHGMSPDIAARIFDPFFTTKPPGEGSGLGLAVVHGVMDSHQGLVLVDSAPGKGTRFELYFPARPSPAQAEPPASGPIPRGLGERILFVDDEAPLVRLGQVTLRELGYEPTARLDPAEALDLLRERPEDFDLVLTDHAMPGMNGIVLAESIRVLRPDLPVVLMTGYCAGPVSEQAKAAGVREVLFKPIDFQTLGKTVRRHLPERPPSRPASP